APSAGVPADAPSPEAGLLSTFEVGDAGVSSGDGGDGAAQFAWAAQGARVDGGFELLLDDWLSLSLVSFSSRSKRPDTNWSCSGV
ncbi:hypothetical protein, partial [Massilia genomosp. 1]|uniref:hypothetical protein n=1 Tax=Massilia genomosp. 1 TaxID=2609280 RepID=UPI001E451CF6